MNIFPSLPEDLGLQELYQRFPHSLRPLLAYHDAVLRDPSPLTVAERETIAAFVSGLNGCTFCHGAHVQTAEAFGVSPRIFSQMLRDIDSVEVDEKFRSMLIYVRKLTLTPSQIVTSDAAAVFAAGWDEQALHDAINVCALFSLMNRIVDGSGIRTNPLMGSASDKAAHFERIGPTDGQNGNGPNSDPHQSNSHYARYFQIWGIEADEAEKTYSAPLQDDQPPPEPPEPTEPTITPPALDIEPPQYGELEQATDPVPDSSPDHQDDNTPEDNEHQNLATEPAQDSVLEDPERQLPETDLDIANPEITEIQIDIEADIDDPDEPMPVDPVEIDQPLASSEPIASEEVQVGLETVLGADIGPDQKEDQLPVSVASENENQNDKS